MLAHALPPPVPSLDTYHSDVTNSPEVSHIEDTPSVAAKHWFKSLSDAIEAKDSTTITAHFLADGYWRDLLSLSWDNRTLHTIPVIKNFLDDNDRLKSSGLRNFKLEGKPVLLRANRDFTWVQCFFTFETNVARGRGFFRLMRGADDGAWKAKTFYTGIEELKGYEEHRGSTRPVGVNHGANTDRKSWKDSRAEKREFIDAEPTVLIIGAGQSGLAVGARLGQLSVDTLLIDKNDRVGDNWRKRYNFLVLHDPVWYDHLPYVTFPPHWPVFTPKDKLGDWFEAYAATMELNIWMQSTITSATYDEPSHLWTVTIARVGHPNRIIKPKFIVLATGHSGEPNIPVFKDQNIFKGHLCHSSQHTTGGSFKGKKAVVVGCCNSGHDIAQDFYEQGADVTIVQRSSTYVMSSAAGLGVLFRGLYEENGPPTEDADIMFSSTPNHMFQILHKYTTEEIAEIDRPTLDGLQKVGFKIDYGIGGSGFITKYFTQGGGYYIDVGASKLIAERKIKLKQGHEISHFTETSVVFDDGTEIEADIVVLATGYKNMKTTAVKILGSEAERMKDVWGLDSEGELSGIYRNSGHPGIYAMGGNLALVRFWSKRLALRIKAQVEGLAPM
ncbi:dimethylaniline monooxygenase [Desarmillaria tabescens]|uniref:Dimethylaniline monooxygenase n=1 Tax=Armillaria tabescens TaxID=1929756 RepID=A0AA39NDN7_ARMTA|nr:dimethylaniline monooxygenase [Desarmillaria tabescens]KAK0463686.1 dimethylaniline monooxygenase [Desarmillaria tabescens]